MPRPSPAELARTAVACARVGTLTTYPFHGPPATTTASVRDDEGAVVLDLAPHRAVARDLLLRPLATVRLAPPGREPVVLQGTARRLPGPRPGLACFRLEAGALRVGRDRQAVGLHDYRSAEPDPLRDEAARVLGHLGNGQGLALAACLRAHGHAGARWAEAVGLDRYGLEVAVLDDEGVAATRLSFPAPVRCVADLPPGLSVVLAGNSRRDPDQAG